MPALAETDAPRMTLADTMKSMDNPPADDTPPDAGQTPAAAQTDGIPTIQEPPIGELAAPEATQTPAETPAVGGTGDDEPETDLGRAMRNTPPEKPAKAVSEPAKDGMPAEAAKPKEGAAAEAAKPTDAPAAQRDADLVYQPGPNTHPKTRQLITGFKDKAAAARDERDAIKAERDALKAERDRIAEEAKKAPVPKELEQELNTLRERVRELDITKDPTLETKYDRKIATNNEAILNVLKAQGFGQTTGADGKVTENPKAIAELMKSGLTLKTLNPLIKRLEEAELIDEAEAIREAVRNNNRLSQEKQQEIESWKGDYSKRQQAKEQQARAETESRQQAFTQQTDSQYRAELEALAKDFASLKQPVAPLASDTPAVQKAKQAALDEYNANATKIAEAIKGLNPQGVAPEKVPEVVGRINALALTAVALKTSVLPKVKQELAARDARIAELEAELGKIRAAGKLSRIQGAAPGEAPGGKEFASFEDALRSAAPGGMHG